MKIIINNYIYSNYSVWVSLSV